MVNKKIKQLTVSEKDGNLVFEIVVPTSRKRSNSYMEEKSARGELGSYNTVTGIIDEKTSEYGFAFTIDMSYKGKDDQFSDFFLEVSAFIEQDEFQNLCKQYQINLVFLPANY